MHARNESSILVLNNYFNLPSSKYANFKVILSLNGLQIKKNPKPMKQATEVGIKLQMKHESIKLVTFRTDGGMEEIL